jgi:hypothetical protein
MCEVAHTWKKPEAFHNTGRRAVGEPFVPRCLRYRNNHLARAETRCECPPYPPEPTAGAGAKDRAHPNGVLGNAGLWG